MARLFKNSFIKNRISLAISVVVVGVFGMHASEAFAAAGHGAHGEMPTFGSFISSLGVYWFNFALYCALIFILTRKKLPQFFASRHASVRDRVQAGQRALAEAQKELEAAKNKRTALPQQIENVRREIRRETELESNVIAADAQTRAARILKLADESAAAERRSVENMVEQELLIAAFDLARTQLTNESSAQTDRNYRDAVVKKVSGLVQ